MKRVCVTLILALLWGSQLPAAEERATTPPKRTFEAFKIIYERNIFNPNRRPMRGGRFQEESAPPPRIEGFSLVGTMIYEQASYAFFDGTDSKYRTVLCPSNQIAGFRLVEIMPNCVRLLRSTTNTIEMPIGVQMRRVDDGEWRLMAGAIGGAAPSAISMTKPSSSDEGPASDAGADDIIKRLMKKREQELNK